MAAGVLTERIMGLELVELVLDIEAHFGIALETRKLERVRTAGDLLDLILAQRVPTSGTTPCLTMHLFHRLRRGMIREFNLRRDAIRPSAQLDDLLAPDLPPERWRQLAQSCGLALPPCRAPDVGTLAPLLAWGALAAFAFSTGQHFPRWAAGGEWLIPTSLFAAAVAIGARRWAAEHTSLSLRIAAHPLTIRDLCENVLATNPDFARQALAEHDRHATWLKLRQIIAEIAGLPVSEVRPDSRFVEDLKFG